MAESTIVTVTLNPALDLTVSLDSLHLGEVNLASQGNLRPAGKGINVALVLKDLGDAVSVTGLLGRDNCQSYEALLDQAGIDNRMVLEAGATRINVKLSEGRGKRITDINLPGIPASDDAWEQLQYTLQQLCCQADTFVLSGSLPPGLKPDRFAELIHLLKGRGKRVLVDTSGEALEAAITAGPDLIKPNREELTQWAGRDLSSLDDQTEVAQRIMNMGVGHVVVSNGAAGVVWFGPDQVWQVEPPAVEVVSTVGAGDSLLAGIAHGLVCGWPVERTLALATAMAALAVNQIGVGVADARLLQQFQQQITPRPLAVGV